MEIFYSEDGVITMICYRMDGEIWYHTYINGNFLHQEYVNQIINITEIEDLIPFLLDKSKAKRDLAQYRLKELENK